MKKWPYLLDGSIQYAYALEVGKAVHGPYRTESAARKAAGKAGIQANILRIRLSATAETLSTYTPK